MKHFTNKECIVCNDIHYKQIGKEEFCIIAKCEGCGSEYTISDETNQIKIRKRMEKKIKSGELDARFPDPK